jgi:octaprenyl-diphosphate synthase
MNDYKKKAVTILENYPESAYKNSLLTMIDYVVARKV